MSGALVRYFTLAHHEPNQPLDPTVGIASSWGNQPELIRVSISSNHTHCGMPEQLYGNDEENCSDNISGDARWQVEELRAH